MSSKNYPQTRSRCYMWTHKDCVWPHNCTWFEYRALPPLQTTVIQLQGRTCGTRITLRQKSALGWSQFKFLYLPPAVYFYTLYTSTNLSCVAWQRKNLICRSKQPHPAVCTPNSPTKAKVRKGSSSFLKLFKTKSETSLNSVLYSGYNLRYLLHFPSPI